MRATRRSRRRAPRSSNGSRASARGPTSARGSGKWRCCEIWASRRPSRRPTPMRGGPWRRRWTACWKMASILRRSPSTRGGNGLPSRSASRAWARASSAPSAARSRRRRRRRPSSPCPWTRRATHQKDWVPVVDGARTLRMRAALELPAPGRTRAPTPTPCSLICRTAQ